MLRSVNVATVVMPRPRRHHLTATGDGNPDCLVARRRGSGYLRDGYRRPTREPHHSPQSTAVGTCYPFALLVYLIALLPAADFECLPSQGLLNFAAVITDGDTAADCAVA